jgi:predicted transposase YbfD/YdcC
VGGGENEIAAALRVLERLELRDTVVTGDALVAQREICQAIRQKGGHYLFPLKGNQPAVRQAIEQALRTTEKKNSAAQAPSKAIAAESKRVNWRS